MKIKLLEDNIYNGDSVKFFIEHNGRPFDANNPEHVKEAEKIKEKALLLGPNSRYWNIYKWWTEIDPKKLKTLRDNNLNFKLIYPNNLIIDK